MTETTPTPHIDELIAEASERLPRMVKSATRDWGYRALAGLKQQRAERDALTAILAEAQAEALTLRHQGYPVGLMLRILSKLPADALAARDARVLREAASRLPKADASAAEWLRDWADRIEREARR